MSQHDDSEEREPFIDDDGNHIYYERSIIEKKEFLKENPEVNEEELRTFSRLFQEMTNFN